MTLSNPNRILTALLGLSISLAGTIQAEHADITTIAGNGVQGYCGDGGPAIDACFYWPSGLALDPAGNLYIGDYFNHCVRRVDATTDVITTVAGACSEAGDSGDGGLATEARLNGPGFIALDPAGNLFINDVFNFRIRRLDTSTGVITTFAGTGECGFSGDGGPALDARLCGTADSAVDASGNLYFPDGLNCRIRRIDAAAPHTITTVAGNGTCGFCGDGGPATSACITRPHGVGLDSAGNLYIADLDNFRIRRVDAVTGVITTVAGQGAPLNNGDCGLAVDANIGGPLAVDFDAQDNMFISSGEHPDFPGWIPNHVVRRVDAATGIISTVAGTGVAGFSGDGGPATHARLKYPYNAVADAAGNLIIADQENNRVRRIEGIAVTVDIDGDSVIDYCDNCIAVVNADQRDTNADSIGNACDADTNNDCAVNFGDLADLKAGFFPNYDPNADFDGDGFVNFGDLAFMKSTFFNGDDPGPGPSGLPNDCDGR